MPSLQIYLFGAPQVERQGQAVNITRRKTVALLAYLATTNEAHSRDLLAALLWPEHDQASARANLRRDLSRLRKGLDKGAIVADRSQVAFNPEAEHWLDVAVFRSHLALVHAHDHFPQQTCSLCLSACQEAVSLYTADFMAGFSLSDSPQFDEWQFFQAESLRSGLADLLQRLIQWHSSKREFPQAIEYGRRWLALDTLHEAAHRQLMVLYAWAGQHAAALRQYAECVRILNEELGVEPEEQTTALYEEIRTRQINPLPMIPDPSEAVVEAQTPLPTTQYQIESLLAIGGQGEVYLGRDLVAGTDVVIKRLKPELIEAEPEYLARFLREGEILRQLNHPNIVQLLGTFEQDGQTHLVIEYVPGGSLRQLLEADLQLTPERAINIALELADALSRAHHLGVIHRDLKPENILLAEDGTPRLTDFGVATLETGDARLTQAGSLLGSPAYMSPEALQSEQVDARTDVWSLGAILYEMLAGVTPFGHEKIATTLLKILQEPAPDLLQLYPDIPVSLGQLVNRMLVKDRRRRLGSMRQVAAALEAIRNHLEPDIGEDGLTPALGQKVISRVEDSSTHSGVDTIHLPSQLTPFVGRHDDVHQIQRLLAEEAACRLLTLVGPNGIGKSRLAIAAASRLSDQFPDGIYFVPLFALDDASLIVPAVAEALDLRFSGATTPKIQMLHYLRSKTMLLLIDNFERVPGGADLIHDILNFSPGVKVLVTSSEPLGLQEAWHYEVRGLARPTHTPADADALATYGASQLFIQRAGRADARFTVGPDDIPAIVEICRQLAGTPLSLELAAPWVCDLTCAEIATEIRRRLGPDAPSKSEQCEPQDGLRAIYQRIGDILSSGEHEVLGRLSVFQGGCSLEAAEAVTGAATATLASLVDRALLGRGVGGRYTLHERTRQFAAEYLQRDVAEEERALDRHCEYYMALLARCTGSIKGGRQVAVLSEISAEMDNVRAAWHRAVSRRQVDVVAKAAECYWLYSEFRGLLPEGESAFQEAADALSVLVEGAGDSVGSLVGFLHVAEGSFRARRGWLDEGVAQMEAGVKQLRQAEAPDRQREAFALVQLAFALVNQGRYSEADSHAQESLELFQQTNDHWTKALGLLLRGFAAQFTGHIDDAEELLLACLNTCAQIDEKRIQTLARAHLGQIALLRGDYVRAGQWYDQVAELNQQLGDRLGRADRLRDQGMLAIAQGDYARAGDMLEESKVISLEVGRSDAGVTLCHLGMVWQRKGDQEKAEALYQESLAAANAARDQAAVANCLQHMGHLAYEQARPGPAEQLLQESLALWQQIGNEPMIAAVTSLLGHVMAHSVQSRSSEAQQHYRQALQLALKHRLAPLSLDVMTGLASLLIHTGATQRATQLLILAEQHPASTQATRDAASQQLATLPPQKASTGRRRGKLLDWQEAAIALATELDTSGWQSQMVPNNLPSEITPLVGRDREIAEIQRILFDTPRSRLVTITGQGGIGKTRLALAVAKSMASSFPNGVFALSLTPFDAENEIVVRLADHIGLRFHDQDEPLAQLLAHVREKQMLLVLDNFEYLLADTSQVLQILQSTTHVQILATSRDRRSLSDEVTFPLAGLTLPESTDQDAVLKSDAVILFLQHANISTTQLDRRPENLEAIVRCCHLVEGLPLAIMLAASWTNKLSPPEIADILARHLDIPASELKGVEPQRRIMQAVLAASWAQLNARQQQALSKMSLFRSGFTWAAAQDVAGASRRELLVLSRQSWLQREAGNRFQMHELVRQFIQEKLTASVDSHTQARQLYLRYYLNLMQQQHDKMRGSEQMEAFAMVAAEFENARLAWDWLLADGRVETAVHNLLPALFQYNETRQNVAVMIPLLAAARDRLRSLDLAESDKRRLMATLLTAQAAFYRTGYPIRFEAFGMSPTADIELVRRAWQTASQGTTLVEMGFWGIVMSYVYGRIVDRQAGAAALRRLITVSREANLRWQLGLGLEFLALLLQSDHDDTRHAEIEMCINEALALFQTSGDKRESGYVLRALGQLRRSQHAFDEAIRYWQAAQAKLQAAGDKRMAADLYWAMGDAYLQIGRYDDAFRSFRKMSRVYLEMGITRFAAEILSKESYEAVRYSSLEHARQARQQSLNLSRETGDIVTEAWGTWEMGEIYRVMGELEKARHWYENARQLFETFRDRNAYIFYHRGLGDLEYAQGNYWESQEQFWHSLEYAREADHHWGVAYARAGLGRASLALDQQDAAREHFVRSLVRGIKANEQGIILATLTDVASWFGASGDSQQAVTLASLVRQHHASWRESKMRAEATLAQHVPASPDMVEAAKHRESQPDVWQMASDTLTRLERASTWRPTTAGDSLLDRSTSIQNLPVRRSPFVGRAKELADIQHYLAEAKLQLLTVLGPGGIGKTRLAIETASSSSAYYEHGVFYVPLAPLEAADQIVSAIAESLGFHSFIADEPRQQVLEYLHNKKALLVLDNYEHLLPDTTLVTEILEHAPKIQVLVTTRQRLNIGAETVYPLTGMPYPQEMAENETDLSNYAAVKLLLDQAYLIRPDYEVRPDDREHLIRICQMVQGMPLALVLAAGWLEMLSFAEIAEEIERSLDFLESERRDLPERQRSVRAVFDGSWARLAATARTVLAKLSVFRGGFTRQAARAIAGADLRTLRTLVNHSFITVSANGRYEIHELLRQYSFEQLTAMGEADATRSAHSAYYLLFMQEREADLKGKRQPEALLEIENELRNVRSAWNWASLHHQRSRIDGAIETLHLFCDMRGRHQEGAAFFAQAREHLASQATGEPDATWHRFLIRHSFLRIFIFSQRPEVLEDLQLGLKLAQEQADQAEVAIAHQAFGTLAYTAQQEPEAALKHFEESYTLFSTLDDPFYLARALVGIGYCYAMLSDAQRCEEFTREALAITRRIGSKVDESVSLANLAEMELSQGKYERAESSFHQAITIAEELKTVTVKAYCLPFANLITLLNGDLSAAEADIRTGLSLAEEINFSIAIAYAQAIISIYEGLSGNYESSQRWAERSIVNPGNNTMGLVLAPWGLALAHCGQQQWTEAKGALTKALNEANKLMYPAPQLWLLPVAAVLAVKHGQPASAVQLLAKASSHPLKATGWMKRWPLLEDLQSNLERELGHDAYKRAWNRGEEMELEAAVSVALSVVQPSQDPQQ